MAAGLKLSWQAATAAPGAAAPQSLQLALQTAAAAFQSAAGSWPDLRCPARAALCSLPAHDGGCYGLAFNRTGDLLASGGADKCVRLWDPFTATPKATLRVSCRCFLQTYVNGQCSRPKLSANALFS